MYRYNTPTKVIVVDPGCIYVFGGEIRKATTFCKRVLMKPPESLPLNN